MEDISSLCRICLTTEEDDKFKPIAMDLAEKIKILFKVDVFSNDTAEAIICRQCETDVYTSWDVFDHIRDADDFLSYHSKVRKKADAKRKQLNNVNKPKPKRPKKAASKPHVSFECDACEVSFDSYQALNEHISGHNLRAFVCFFCKDDFKSSADRVVHLTAVHKQKMNVLKQALETSQENIKQSTEAT